MKLVSVIAISMLLLASAARCDIKAVIVAGSSGYWNYRHQADACHAYQTLRNGGIPAKDIILFAYNDIANNRQNVFPGKLFNKPNGKDVYGGCVIDYQKGDVTPTNYLNVIQGKKAAMANIGTGRVLESTENDEVFLSFFDHGAPGLIAFPSKYLYVDDFTKALEYMASKKMFKKLVYYLEACESGSMFENFPKNLKIYAVTAANPTESSWAAYCGAQAVVQGKKLGVCLGDLFSVTWLEDVDAEKSNIETLATQYTKTKRKTAKSHVMQYGDTSFVSDKTETIVGKQNQVSTGFFRTKHIANESAIDSRDVKLHFVLGMHAKHGNSNSMNQLNQELVSRKHFDDVFAALSPMTSVNTHAKVTDMDCYKKTIATFTEKCGRFTDYGLKYLRQIYNTCAANPDAASEFTVAFEEICNKEVIM